MFTWICPQCGREVPPSMAECPDCAEKAKAASPAAPAASQPAAAAPSDAPPRPPPPPPRPPAAASRGMPGWAVTLLVAAVLVGLGAVGFLFLRRSKTAQAEPQEAKAVMESPTDAPATPHRLSKFLEIAGIRLVEEKQKPTVRCLLVNHSPAEIGPVRGAVTLRAADGKGPVASFPIQVKSIGPWESMEIVAAVDTKLRAYELPDWQFLRAELRITSQ